MNEKAIEIISDILKTDKDTLVAQIDDNGVWDSLRKVEVIFAIEDEFDVVFDEDELSRIDTPKKLCDILAGKVEGK